ncbi:MAG: TetR/AcrR family transcriptional regulator [Eubacterium sp.]|nr:TetR/AcrR family transcriptional regulator [Eubacterium sp.]
MYCGSNKTALQSQRQIAEAMMTLLEEKPFDKITISELCKTAGISRQTFYSLFTSRENVIVFALRENCCDGRDVSLPQDHRDPESIFQSICRGYSEYMLRNRSIIKLLVDNHIDYLLYNSFFESIHECECFLPSTPSCRRTYAAAFYASGIAGVARVYAKEGCTTTADDLQEILASLLSGKMQ